MLHHKSRSACGEKIHVQQILAELWSLTLTIFTHLGLSSQLLLHPCMDLNEKFAGMLHHKSSSACGEIIHVRQILAELWSLTLTIFTHLGLSSQLLLHPCMDLNEKFAGMLHHKSRSACGEIIHVQQILAEFWSLTLRIYTHLGLSSKLLLPCMDLNESWQGCCTTSLECMWGDNSCLTNVGRIMVLDTYNFYTVRLVFSTPPTSLHGFE